jgi:hypothetical protein
MWAGGRFNGMTIDAEYKFNVVNGGYLRNWTDFALDTNSILHDGDNAVASHGLYPRWFLFQSGVYFEESAQFNLIFSADTIENQKLCGGQLSAVVAAKFSSSGVQEIFSLQKSD